MAHPWIFESNFETGNASEWDTETDTASKLSFPHYTELARIPGLPAPYRGAYCAMWDLRTGTTSDSILIEGDIDIGDDGTAYFRWYMWISPTFTATADDTFNFFELQQAGGTVEMSLGFRITAATNLLEIGIGDGTAPTSFVHFPRGKWVAVELLATPSTGGSGAMTLYLDGYSVASLATLTQAAAVGRGVLGTQDTLATTTGIILADQFIMDDARVFPFRHRFPQTVNFTKSTHIFVGPGHIDSAALMSYTAGNLMHLYDTDVGNGGDAEGFVAEFDLSAFASVAGPLYFSRGCYAELAGTNPKGSVTITSSHDEPGATGPAHHWSDAAIRNWGAKKLPATASE